MSIRYLLLVLSLLTLECLDAQNNYTPTYDELLAAYKSLSEEFPKTSKLDSFGLTDRGVPLHALIINSEGIFNRDSIRDDVVVLVMNGIHPGEACGINASLAFAKEKLKNPQKNITYCIIPIYNTGGMMNRGSYSRANQEGPDEYGFRGNARNLDLNRDFVKADSENTKSFYRLFQTWKPHIFIDTHTSNGADYQPTLTLLSSFPENMESVLGEYLRETMEPALYSSMRAKGQEMVPYVNVFGTTPDSGYKAFTDYPRYSTGYASFFNTIGFTTEAHMLKPFDERVKATYQFLESISQFAAENYQELIERKTIADSLSLKRATVPFAWTVSDRADSIEFPGYRADTEIISSVTGQKTLRYDRKAPYREKIPYFAYHEARDEYQIPRYYILSGAWTEVAELLELNGVEYKKIEKDTTIRVQSTYISSFESSKWPYEGHFKHSDIKTRAEEQEVQFFPGDLIIPTQQPARKYLAHVFNPEASDSFFSWNFFDSCLMQKEYFSSYVFDETAAELLESNAELKKEFEQKKKNDAEFRSNARQQLDFIYKRSPHYEKSHRRLPVYEIH